MMRIEGLCCPKCGNTDPSEIRYIEVCHHYRAVRVDAGDVIVGEDVDVDATDRDFWLCLACDALTPVASGDVDDFE